jgi:glycosyltransferase involved in cell wall biosynthesis
VSATLLRVLVFSTLYPNAREPFKGLFVEQRVRQWHSKARTDTRVVAPIPWWPWKRPSFGLYSLYANVPREETRSGISVLHPRYLVIPKIGMTLAPLLMFLAMIPVLKRLVREGWQFDVIDAHYFYPDGVAAALLGLWFRKPVIVTARGSDLNVIARYALPRRMIAWAARRAARNITVAAALRDRLIAIGADPGSIEVLPNGVDQELFAPRGRAASRAAVGMPGPLLISVGRLVPLKGHDLVIQALPELPGWHLAIVGDGDSASLKDLAQRLGVADRVFLVGPVAQADLPTYYSAADALVLASESEGMPNVVLEALACGTPVIATRVGDVPSIVSSPAVGRLLPERSATAIVRAVKDMEAAAPDAAELRATATRFSWSRTSEGQLRVLCAAGARAS